MGLSLILAAEECEVLRKGEELRESMKELLLQLWIWTSLSQVWLFATPRGIAYQAPQSMGFFQQEYWSGLPFPSPGELPDPGIEPGSPALQAESSLSAPLGSPLLQLEAVTSSSVSWNDLSRLGSVGCSPVDSLIQKGPSPCCCHWTSLTELHTSCDGKEEILLIC